MQFNHIVFVTLIGAAFLLVYSAVTLNHSDGEHRVNGLSKASLCIAFIGLIVACVSDDVPSMRSIARRS